MTREPANETRSRRRKRRGNNLLSSAKNLKLGEEVIEEQAKKGCWKIVRPFSGRAGNDTFLDEPVSTETIR